MPRESKEIEAAGARAGRWGRFILTDVPRAEGFRPGAASIRARLSILSKAAGDQMGDRLALYRRFDLNYSVPGVP